MINLIRPVSTAEESHCYCKLPLLTDSKSLLIDYCLLTYTMITLLNDTGIMTDTTEAKIESNYSRKRK